MVKIFYFLIFASLLSLTSGCENDKKITNNELESKLEEQTKHNEELTQKNTELLEQLAQKKDMNSQDQDPDFRDFLNMSLSNQNSLISQYEHSGMGGIGLSYYDLFMVTLIKQILDPDEGLKIEEREKNIIDDQILLFNPKNLVQKLGNEHYLIMKLNQPLSFHISPYTKPLSEMAIYVYEDHLLLTIYNNEEYSTGFFVLPEYYKEMFIRVGELKKELLMIQCGGSEDC